jgi:DNA-binding beta-propeller fold protein YncE
LLLSFLSTVKLMHSLNEDMPVVGLTTLNNELYVRRQKWRYDADKKVAVVDEGNDDMITVYDTQTYSLQRTLQIPRIGYVTDMVSCNRHQCVYIADDDYRLVYKIGNKSKITHWPVNDKPHGLSVNSVYNVLVACDVAGKIKEFTTDGQLKREITVQSGIVKPTHAVELTTDQFVVCHSHQEEPQNRVSIVDWKGCILQSYNPLRILPSRQLNVPVRLIVNGFVFVSDLNNDRVLMLSPKLNYIREVVTRLNGPLRMWFDENTGRLYVADNEWGKQMYVTGNVKIYSVYQ